MLHCRYIRHYTKLSAGKTVVESYILSCVTLTLRSFSDTNADLCAFRFKHIKHGLPFLNFQVLMNLANDNPEGCRQIAKLGGLEILSSLIADHFPSFSLSMPHSDNARESSLSTQSSSRIDLQSNTCSADQELDFLVAILGLLVNMVEKDGRNR